MRTFRFLLASCWPHPAKLFQRYGHRRLFGRRSCTSQREKNNRKEVVLQKAPKELQVTNKSGPRPTKTRGSWFNLPSGAWGNSQNAARARHVQMWAMRQISGNQASVAVCEVHLCHTVPQRRSKKRPMGCPTWKPGTRQPNQEIMPSKGFQAVSSKRSQDGEQVATEPKGRLWMPVLVQASQAARSHFQLQVRFVCTSHSKAEGLTHMSPNRWFDRQGNHKNAWELPH